MATEQPVARVASERGFTDVTPVGRGLEFAVFGAVAPDGGRVVLRAALEGRRFQANANDPRVDTRRLLVWEHAVTGHLGAHGFPVARARELVLGDPDVLISDFVPDDGAAADQPALGRLLRALHRLPPPVAGPVAAEGLDFATVLARRLVRRWGELDRLVPDLPDAPRVERVLAGRSGTSLLHLDVRADNLRCAGGTVLGLLDWSNALVGDPDLELCRIAEFARIPGNALDVDAVVAGYGTPIRGDDASWVYRLDAAVMLALVFLSEAPDPVLGPAAVDRVRRLRAHVL